MTAPTPLTRCSFYRRTPVEGAFRYDAIGVRGWHGDGCLYTAHPPLPGDLIDFWDDDEHVQYRDEAPGWDEQPGPGSGA